MQCVAVRCSVLQCAAVCCSVLQRVAVRLGTPTCPSHVLHNPHSDTLQHTLQHIATHCNTWQRTARQSGLNRVELLLHNRYATTLQLTASHCITLQHSAPHCNTLHHTATNCNTPQHIATHGSKLQHTATHCNTLQHTAKYCNTLQHTAPHCNTLHHTATNCNALQHTATQSRLNRAEQFLHNRMPDDKHLHAPTLQQLELTWTHELASMTMANFTQVCVGCQKCCSVCRALQVLQCV